MMSLQELARVLGGEVRGNQVLAPGPGHSQKDRSLSIKLDSSKPHQFVVHSFSGDDPIRCKDYVRGKVGHSRSSDRGDEFPRWKSMIATYDYRDESGELLFQVVRSVPKDFRQRRPDGRGGWIWSLGQTRRVLYRLPEIIEAVASHRAIFVAEGEKAVEALVRLGFPATCSPGGAGKWRGEYSQYLASADVVIVPDHDEPGEQHCAMVASSLNGIASRVRVLRLPGLLDKEDAYNWVQAGGTAEQIWSLLEKKADPLNTKPTASRSDSPGLICRCASEVELERIEWLWPGRIARGKHTCIAGEPGTGKSQLSIFLAATVSLGGEWPCGEGRAPRGSVILFSAEDGESDTIVPRLYAAGADCGRVHTVRAVNTDGRGRRAFNLQADLDLLEEKIAEIGDVLLVVVDPISSYLGKADSHKNAEVRGVLEPLSEMAERLRVAILSVTHFSKANGGQATKALHKFIGSIAFVGAPRAAFAVIEDPADRERRLFLYAKNNLAAPSQGLAFRLEQTVISGNNIVTSRVRWESEPVTITANEALVAETANNGRTAIEEAKSFLRELLSAGPMAAKQVWSEVEEAGLASATVRRAQEQLGIKPKREALVGAGLANDGRWVWTLP